MSKKLSEVGKALRTLRIERDIKMKEMANAMGVSVSFLSAVEVGSKTVPMEKLEKVITHYDLKGPEAMRLRRLAAASKQVVRIPVQPDRRLVTAFARKVRDLNKDQRERMLAILEEE